MRIQLFRKEATMRGNEAFLLKGTHLKKAKRTVENHAASVISFQKFPAVFRFLTRKLPQTFHWDCAMLKAAFRKDGHIKPRYRFDSAAYNFAFELIKLLNVIIGQRDKRNTF